MLVVGWVLDQIVDSEPSQVQNLHEGVTLAELG